jgi:hypothetical protein
MHPDYPILTPVVESSVSAKVVATWIVKDIHNSLDPIALDWAAVCAARVADRLRGSLETPGVFDRRYWAVIAREVLNAFTDARSGVMVNGRSKT